MMMELDAFTAYVTQALDEEIPAVLLQGLNLGVIVKANLERSKSESQFIIMGLYVQNQLGKQIILYYGSFLYFYKDSPSDLWKAKILHTIKHELTHHVEALAGQEDLAKKERYEVELRKKEANLRKKK
jgi:predicted Zn-dependent protease with MMP-like domain